MALVRLTEKKLAANRANARRSLGPSTPAGKQRVSRNACRHHLFARKFTMPETWEDRIWAAIAPAAANVEDPVERACATRYFFLLQWLIELDSFEVRLINQSTLDHHGDLDRGLQHFVRTNPLFHAIETRIHTLNRLANRARTDWNHAKRAARSRPTTQTIPQVVENKPPFAASPSPDLPAEFGSAPIAAPLKVCTNRPTNTIKDSFHRPDCRADRARTGSNPATHAASTTQTIPQVVENTPPAPASNPLVRAAAAGAAPDAPTSTTQPAHIRLPPVRPAHSLPAHHPIPPLRGLPPPFGLAARQPSPDLSNRRSPLDSQPRSDEAI